MSKQSLTIKGELPNLNAVIAAAKLHYANYAAVKKQHTYQVFYLAKAQLKPIRGSITISVYWISKNARVDPDNLSHGIKYILDGLVMAKIIEDDNRSTVKKIVHHFPEPDKKNPYVKVVLEDEQVE